MFNMGLYFHPSVGSINVINRNRNTELGIKTLELYQRKCWLGFGGLKDEVNK